MGVYHLPKWENKLNIRTMIVPLESEYYFVTCDNCRYQACVKMSAYIRNVEIKEVERKLCSVCCLLPKIRRGVRREAKEVLANQFNNYLQEQNKK